MSLQTTLPLKKLSLHALVASVGISALLGILAILVGNFGQSEFRILMTTLAISAASLCSLSCGALVESKGIRGVPDVGFGLALLAAVLVTGCVWSDSFSETYWKSATTVAVFAVAAAHVSLLLLARLSSAYRWAHWVAHGVVLGVAAIITSMLWLETNGESMFRLLGVAAILDGAITILVPVFRRLSRNDLDDSVAVAAIEREIEELRTRQVALERRRDQLSANAMRSESRDSVAYRERSIPRLTLIACLARHCDQLSLRRFAEHALGVDRRPCPTHARSDPCSR